MADKRRFIGLIIALVCVSSNVYSADKIYTTDFSLTEDRISDGGNLWINGAATGVDWTNVKTSNGNATGTMNRLPDGVSLYDDSVAVLKGTWGADQTVEATIHAANRTGGGSSGYDGNEFDYCTKEVELILRGVITANSINLYEVLFSSRIGSPAYHQIARWSGVRGNYYTIFSDEGSLYQVNDGDVVKATMVGNVINAYINDVLVSTVTDTNYSMGSPGVGFYSSKGCTGTAHNDDFGFTSFTATSTGTSAGRIPNRPSIISISP